MPYVNGVYMNAPGAVVVLNDVGFQSSVSNSGLGLLLIGPATDGQPNTPLVLTSPANAVQQLKGGDGLQSAVLAFNALASGIGPSQITFIRPELATQATSLMVNTTTQITLTTTSYGTLANSAKWMVQAGSTVGFQVSQGTDFVGPGNQTYPTVTQDNIALPVISIAYTGTDTSPTVTITDSEFTLSATSGGTQINLAQITLTNTLTVQQLVNQLNVVSGVVAVVMDPNPGDITAALFDNQTSLAISTTASNPTTLSANVEAVVRWFNNSPVYFTATRAANATTLSPLSTWTYATGGTTPVATNTNWQAAYTTAQGETGISLVSPVAGSASIWAMNDAHCKYMTSVGQPRRSYVGDVSGTAFTTEQANAAALNSNRTTFVWPEQQEVNINGQIATIPGYIIAGMIAAQRSMTPAPQAMTHQPILSLGCSVTVTPGMVAQGLASGICMLAPNSTGSVIITQDRTTWLQTTAYDKVENSTGLVADIITQDLNVVLGQFVGQPVSQAVVGAATLAVLARLNYWYKNGYIVTAPQTSDVSLTGSGDTITGSAQAALAIPANYIVMALTPVAA